MRKKYNWHDLQENPEDLPKESGLYLVVGWIEYDDYCQWTYKVCRYWCINERFETDNRRFHPDAWMEIKPYRRRRR